MTFISNVRHLGNIILVTKLILSNKLTDQVKNMEFLNT